MIARRNPQSSPESSAFTAAAQPASPSKPAAQPAHRDYGICEICASNSLKASAEKNPRCHPASSPAPGAHRRRSPCPGSAGRTTLFHRPTRQNLRRLSRAREVLDQVLPDALKKLAAPSRGKVRVTVRVHVEPGGNVSQANSMPPAEQVFADLAPQAARRWEFTAPSERPQRAQRLAHPL